MSSFDKIKVTDRQSFIKFLELLHDDLRVNKSEWENKTLEDFIEAMASYAQDIQGYYNNSQRPGEVTNADIPSWQTFAEIFKGARVYE